MSKILRDLLIIIASFGAIWAAFSLIPWGDAETSLDYPVEKEEELGEILIESMEVQDHAAFIYDSYVDSVVVAIANRLMMNLDSSEYSYQFHIQKTEDVNAFALPGGHIVINSALLEFAERPEEVAAVLAHEIGHVESKHLVKRLGKEFGIQLLFGILVGGDQLIINEISKSATSTYFDREQEKDADQFALDLLHKSEINPMYLGTFFRRLKRSYSNEFDMEMFSTHPNTSSRIQKSFQFANDSTIKNVPLDIQWDVFQDSLQVILNEN